MDKLNKLSLPVTIIIASFILGGFFYASQVNKQRSIERQQQAELEAEDRVKKEAVLIEVKEDQNYNQQIEKADGPNTSDRIYVKELCENKYQQVEREFLDLVVNEPGYIDFIKDYYAKHCAEGSTFDRLESPYYCHDRNYYVNTREVYVSYCEDYYLGR